METFDWRPPTLSYCEKMKSKPLRGTTLKARWQTPTPTRRGQHITHAHSHSTRSISSHGPLFGPFGPYQHGVATVTTRLCLAPRYVAASRVIHRFFFFCMYVVMPYMCHAHEAQKGWDGCAHAWCFGHTGLVLVCVTLLWLFFFEGSMRLITAVKLQAHLSGKCSPLSKFYSWLLNSN